MADSKNPYLKVTGGTKGNDSLTKPGQGKTVVVAMSGGVDSSAAAALLKEQGYSVVGIALQTTDYSKYLTDDSGGTCCSVKDIEDARRVAEKLRIPFYVLNTEKTFDHAVVDYFVADYLQGRTPNPCVMCNTKVKFNHLYRKAMDIGADFIATGHYAKVSIEPGLGACLWLSEDTQKDQTYFLFNLTQAQLEKTLFPVGHLPKSEVRKIALKYELPVSEKPDSQEICFVGDNNYVKFVESRSAPEVRRGGGIILANGTLLAQHDGIHKYTVGQRKGLGEALDKIKMLGYNADDFSVTRIDPTRRLVIMGDTKNSMKWGLVASQMNWIVAPDLRKERYVKVRIRHRAEFAEALISPMLDNQIEVRFFQPQKSITPGQALVIYDGSMCLGGGFIGQIHDIEETRRPTQEDRPASAAS